MKKNQNRSFQLRFKDRWISVTLLVILCFALFIRIYRLDELMQFIGDFAWFYLSARDFLLKGDIPLVGITSSQVWLHQGPLWTYMLSIPLILSNFHPLSGGYLSAILGTLTVYLIYRVGSVMFSVRTGLIAAILYAASPLAIFHSRLPYHTSPIPLFIVGFIYVFFRWIKGSVNYFPWVILFLGILYNFELATTVLWFPVVGVLMYGFISRKKFATTLFSKKILFLSTSAFIISMFPILIYDLKNEFVQTAKFAHWVLYYKLGSGLLSGAQGIFSSNISEILSFLASKYQQLIFFRSVFLTATIGIVTLFWLVFKLISMFKLRKYDANYMSLFIISLVCIGGLVFNNVASEAYIPILIPPIIIITALVFDSLIKSQISQVLIFALVLIFSLSNSYVFVEQNYQFSKTQDFNSNIRSLSEASRTVIQISDGKPYTLVGKGQGSEHASFTNNIEYITWWMENPPSKSAKQKISIEYEEKGICVKRELLYNSN